MLPIAHEQVQSTKNTGPTVMGGRGNAVREGMPADDDTLSFSNVFADDQPKQEQNKNPNNLSAAETDPKKILVSAEPDGVLADPATDVEATDVAEFPVDAEAVLDEQTRPAAPSQLGSTAEKIEDPSVRKPVQDAPDLAVQNSSKGAEIAPETHAAADGTYGAKPKAAALSPFASDVSAPGFPSAQPDQAQATEHVSQAPVKKEPNTVQRHMHIIETAMAADPRAHARIAAEPPAPQTTDIANAPRRDAPPSAQTDSKQVKLTAPQIAAHDASETPPPEDSPRFRSATRTQEHAYLAPSPAAQPQAAHARPMGLDPARAIIAPGVAEVSLPIGGDIAEVVQWDLRPAQPSSSLALPNGTPARLDLPPAVAQQISVAMHNAPDKPVEIALNPPELGRVRMIMNASEAGIVVQVLTERTDTLDLMRRNIDELARALADLGYEDIGFSFGQHQQQAASDNPGSQKQSRVLLELGAMADAQDEAAGAKPDRLALAPDTIDIRL